MHLTYIYNWQRLCWWGKTIVDSILLDRSLSQLWRRWRAAVCKLCDKQVHLSPHTRRLTRVQGMYHTSHLLIFCVDSWRNTKWECTWVTTSCQFSEVTHTYIDTQRMQYTKHTFVCTSILQELMWAHHKPTFDSWRWHVEKYKVTKWLSHLYDLHFILFPMLYKWTHTHDCTCSARMPTHNIQT